MLVAGLVVGLLIAGAVVGILLVGIRIAARHAEEAGRASADPVRARYLSGGAGALDLVALRRQFVADERSAQDGLGGSRAYGVMARPVVGAWSGPSPTVSFRYRPYRPDHSAGTHPAGSTSPSRRRSRQGR